jgi:hypothetical protein
VQIAATPQPLSEKEKTGFSDKLAKVHRTFIEDITQDSVYKFKYYTNDFFGDEGKAKDFAKKLQKLGIKGYVISFKEENNRL